MVQYGACTGIVQYNTGAGMVQYGTGTGMVEAAEVRKTPVITGKLFTALSLSPHSLAPCLHSVLSNLFIVLFRTCGLLGPVCCVLM